MPEEHDLLEGPMSRSDALTHEFREKVLYNLAEIKVHVSRNRELLNEFIHESRQDRKELRACTDLIPGIELKLKNHLHTHETITKALIYPVVLAAIVAGLTAFAKVILHVF